MGSVAIGMRIEVLVVTRNRLSRIGTTTVALLVLLMVGGPVSAQSETDASDTATSDTVVAKTGQDDAERTGSDQAGSKQSDDVEPIQSITISPQIQTMELIRAKMDEVAKRLDRADTSTTVQDVQLDVLAELDRLIAADSANSSTNAAQKQQSEGQGEDENATGQQTADDGGGQTGGEGSVSNDSEPSRRDLIDRAWGHLPDRIRERMQSALGEEFLPKYEKLIEAYYKRLANADQDGP